MFLKRVREEIFKSDVDGESVPPPSASRRENKEPVNLRAQNKLE